ncbi:MAG: hypothetical protein HW381_414 [Candidatus Rokubacteria bacterium]|nr:hypothetical protein [Candidatus Rokubacteria bacterium]
MRGMAKPWPPADVSPDGRVPCTFVHAEQQYLAALPAAQENTAFARAQFSRLEKRKLREVMYREQRSLCVYCERRIQESHPAPRIEHWRPLSRDHQHALCWKNLYLSCPTPGTCDDAKGDRPLKWDDAAPDLPWPTDRAYEDLLGFTSRGEIYVRSDVALDVATRKALELAIDDRHDGDRVRSAVLNLNHPALLAARAAALDSERTRLQKDFEARTASRGERAQRVTDLVAGNPLLPFVSIRAAWLCKVLGRGR